ncbi:MAG: DUF4392 domain-containing protein [Deltaproteobacteria bacterium]|nr:DUF4392 domain-containing protein [Deltaproteobacteria bacterium]MBW2084236.1 DUF4392 domain-containing protein [Deltaproteobacteria bacterium]
MIDIEQLSRRVEQIILQHGRRGMDKVYEAMRPGYCGRAARMILDNIGVMLIGTGFPVGCGYESDGPIGALAIYKVLEVLGGRPIIVCAPPLSSILSPSFAVREMQVSELEKSGKFAKEAMTSLSPDLILSIEMPGIASDGRYYNMNKEDISHQTPKFDYFLTQAGCPTICFGDGGNEVGMGNVKEALANIDIIPSITGCDELVIATVSNWGVYGVVAMLCVLTGKDLFSLIDPTSTAEFLVANGCVDGITVRPDVSEDGFPIHVGVSIIAQLRLLVREAS